MANVYDVDAMVARFESIFSGGTPEQVAAGMAWYPNAHRTVRLGALAAGVTIDVAAHALAALSTQTGWARNLAAFEAHVAAMAKGYDAPQTQGYGTVYASNDVKAGRILRQMNAALISMDKQGNAKRGGAEKTRAFAMNCQELAAFEDGRAAITIDSWMLKLAGHGGGKSGPSTSLYNAVSLAVERFAAKHGMKGYEAQAVLWVIGRGSAE